MSDFRIVQYKDLNIPKWMSAKYDNCLQKYGLRANEFQRLPVYYIQYLFDMPSNYVKMCQYGLDRMHQLQG